MMEKHVLSLIMANIYSLRLLIILINFLLIYNKDFKAKKDMDSNLDLIYILTHCASKI